MENKKQKKKKTPKDINQIAAYVVEAATKEKPPKPSSDKKKS
jgi:hypothetical protein